MRSFFKAKILGAAVATVFMASSLPAAFAEDHKVETFTKAPNGDRHVFSENVIFIEVGDTITFEPTDRTHNSASIDGMIPEGAEPWKGKISKPITVTFDVPGVYGYKCTPHYSMGMVGLVVVGNDLSNLDDAKAVKQKSRAKKAFPKLFKKLEEMAAEQGA